MKRLLSAISVLCILFLFVQREDDSELCWGYYLTEMLDGMGLVNTTEHFATYVVGDDGVIIETAGKEYLYTDIEYTSNYMSSPTWKEADFDRDGINELAMITFVKLCTKITVDSYENILMRKDCCRPILSMFLPPVNTP